MSSSTLPSQLGLLPAAGTDGLPGSGDDGPRFKLFSDELDQEYPSILTPKTTMFLDYNHLKLQAFLGLCDQYNVDLLSMVWHAGLDRVSLGARPRR